MHLSIYPSIYLSIYLSIYPSIYLSIFPSINHTYIIIYPSIILSFYPPVRSIHPSIYRSISPSIHPFIYRSNSPSCYPDIDVSIHLCGYASAYLCIYLSVYLSVCLSMYSSIYPSIHLSIYLSIYLFILPMKWFTYLSICLPEGKYARFPSKVDVGRSKPKQFCETSSKIEADSFKTKISCKTFQFWYKVAKRALRGAELTASYQCILPCCHLICLKYSACFEKRKPRHTKCRTYHAKSF